MAGNPPLRDEAERHRELDTPLSCLPGTSFREQGHLCGRLYLPTTRSLSLHHHPSRELRDGSVSIRWLDHTAIAVHSIEAALPLYRDILGGDPQELSHSPEKGFSTLTLRFPHGGAIELSRRSGQAASSTTSWPGEARASTTSRSWSTTCARPWPRRGRPAVRIVDENYDRPNGRRRSSRRGAPTARSSSLRRPTRTWKAQSALAGRCIPHPRGRPASSRP